MHSDHPDREMRERSDRRAGICLLIAALAILFVIGILRPAAAQDSTTGTIATTGGAVTVSVVDAPSQTVQLSGTWVGVLLFEYTVDNGVTWKALTVTTLGTGEYTQAALGNGVYSIQNAGFSAARVRASALQSGSVTVTVTRGFSTASPPSSPCNPLLHAAAKC